MNILSIFIISVNSCNVFVFYFCIFNNKLDLFKRTCFIIVLLNIALFVILVLRISSIEISHKILFCFFAFLLCFLQLIRWSNSPWASPRTSYSQPSHRIAIPRNSCWKGRISTVRLLAYIACVAKIKKKFQFKSSLSKLVNKRRLIVLSIFPSDSGPW